MKISRITTQVKNPERVNIFVDGAYSFSLSLDELLVTKLKNNQELSGAELKKLKQLSSDGKLRMRAFEWLLRRPHSARELKDYLYKKQASEELTVRVITDAQKRGYQNDEAFARWWVEQRRAGKQRSARFISQELGAKGVDREVIASVLAENETSDADALRVLIAKKRRSARYVADEQKLIEYLARQGYSFSLIKELLAEE